MLFGKDFPKIEFSLFGLDLLEPNALIWNWILFLLALFLAGKLKRNQPDQPFVRYWIAFFLIFGIGLFFGGLGHSLWNYWGAQGKIIPFSLSIISIYSLEQAMISIHPQSGMRRWLVLASKVKLVLVLIILGLVFVTVDVDANLPKGFAVPGINASVGLIFSLVLLPLYYRSKNLGNFNYFFLSILVMLPTTVFQVLKINLHPWMDRNDVAHVLMAVSFLLYWKGITNHTKRVQQ